MHIDDKFGPLLCLNVLNLNTYFGCCNCQFFWMYRKFTVFIRIFMCTYTSYYSEFFYSGIEKKVKFFLQHRQLQWHQGKNQNFDAFYH